MTSQLFLKDPDAILDYQIDWNDWLGEDTILTSTWVVPTGITKTADQKTTKTTTIWLSGGTAGTYYAITNRITTASQRTEDREILVLVSPLVAYCSLAEVKAALNEPESTWDNDIMLAVLAASEAIDGYCHRSFVTSSSAARYFSAEYGDFVVIDDATTISAVATDETGDGLYSRVWATTDYVTRPANTSPKTSIKRATNGRYSFPTRRDGVKVTAIWGYGAVPNSVRRFAVQYAQRLFLRKDAPFGIFGGGGVVPEVYIPKNDPDAMMLLGPYVRADSRIGVF